MTKPTVERIALKDLCKFADSAAQTPQADAVVPMSRMRAHAWSRNPNADPEDVALLVAKLEGRCVGYLGLMPGLLKLRNDYAKVFWASAFYVSPPARSSGTGALLLMSAIGLGYNLAAAGPSQLAEPLFQSLRFQKLRSLPYLQCHLSRLNFIGLSCRAARRALHALHLNPVLANRGLDFGRALTNATVYTLLSPGGSADTHALTDLPKCSFESEQDVECPSRFYRDASVIKWMMSHPWVATRYCDATPGYYFGDFRDHFEHEVIGLTHGGFAVLRFATRHDKRFVHVLDHHFRDDGEPRALAGIALQRAVQFKADAVILPDVCGAHIAGGRIARFVCERVERATYLRLASRYSKWQTALHEVSPAYCDGDIPFT